MSTAVESRRPSKAMLWAGYIVSLAPVAMLLLSAAMKFSGSEQVVQGFKDLGWPDNLALTLGVVELASTILYLIPQTSVLGAILLTGYLGGAVATHARLEQSAFITPVVLGVLVWLGLYLRDPRLRALIPLRTQV
jgi:hypothetical protein